MLRTSLNATAVAAVVATLGMVPRASAQDALARELASAPMTPPAQPAPPVIPAAPDPSPTLVAELATPPAPAAPTQIAPPVELRPAADLPTAAPRAAPVDVELSFNDVVGGLGMPASAPAPDAPIAPPFRLGLGAPALSGAALDRRQAGWRLSTALAGCDGAACESAWPEFAVLVRTNERGFRVGASAGAPRRIASLADAGAPSSWYVFLAADTQAMTWNLRSRQDDGAVRLNDIGLLGDAQAGIGARVHGGDLAIGYVTREVSHMGASRQEEFVGLTFAWEG